MRSTPRKRVSGWIALLLPILLLRALIPVGFMPMVGRDHSVRLVVCDSYAPMPAALMDMSMDPDMDMSPATDVDGHGRPPIHQDHGSCPYGSSPALAALPNIAVMPLAAETPAPIPLAVPQIGFFQAPIRAQSPRAPPV